MSDKKRLLAALLCFFFGIFGAHRFYAGKIGTGFLQLLTIGGLGIWAMIDLLIILFVSSPIKKAERSGIGRDKQTKRSSRGVGQPRPFRFSVSEILGFGGGGNVGGNKFRNGMWG